MKGKGEYLLSAHPPAKPARAAMASQISHLMLASNAVPGSAGFSPLSSRAPALDEGPDAAGASLLHLSKIRRKEKAVEEAR